jgi:hypothetical protein
MTKNILLNIGVIICKFLRLFYIVIFLILTGIFVHYQISPSTYQNVDFDSKVNSTGFTLKKSSSYKIHVDGKLPKDSEVFTFDKLKYSSLYFNFIKFTIVMLLSYLCVKEFQRVIESVKKIKAFQKRNISSFRRIAIYLSIIFLLVSYWSFSFEQGGTSGFYFYFEPLILALLAYIMAEIFKEGNDLLEENKLTV